MTKYQRCSSRLARIVLAGSLVSLSAPVAFADPAGPPPVAPPAVDAPLPNTADGLIERLDGISRETEENTERVKGIEDRIGELDKQIAELSGRYDDVARAAQHAADQAHDYQNRVNDIALSKYRRVSVDPVTAVIGSKDPQEAIDRAAVLTSLQMNTDRTIGELEHKLTRADDTRDAAARAKAQAEFTRSELANEQRQLKERQSHLKELQEKVRAAVDNLSPEEKARWVAKNGPLEGESETAPVVGSSASGNQAVAAAMSKLGSPYGWGAVGPNTFDCSGLMYWAYQQTGKTIPRTSQAQMAGGTPVSLDQLQPGDIVGYYSSASHVGMYIGDGRIVHASDYGIPVQVVPLKNAPIYGARRY